MEVSEPPSSASDTTMIVELPAVPALLLPASAAPPVALPTAGPRRFEVQPKRPGQSPVPGSAQKGKKKKKVTEKRFMWTNEMISTLLEMRFGDEDVKRRVESADTNLKKRLAWQHFAGRISEKLNVVLTSDQVVGKYKKLKCEYRKGTNSRNKTGNEGKEDDSELWSILNSAFAGRSGISGALLGDIDDETDYPQENSSFASPEAKKKTDTPIAMLAAAMKDGMTAIASSLGGEEKTDDKLVIALGELKKSQDANRLLQEKQIALLEALVNKMT